MRNTPAAREPGDHRHQPRGRRFIAQGLAVQVDDRAVGDLDDRQRCTAGLDEQHRDVFVVEGGADRLRQCCRGEQRRHQHHTADIASGELQPQPRNLGGVGPGHPGGGQLITALGRGFAGANQRGDHLIGGRVTALVGSDFDVVFLDGRPAGVGPLDQHHPDC
jgi:hypothetical protein